MYYLVDNLDELRFKPEDKAFLLKTLEKHNRIMEEASAEGLMHMVNDLQRDFTNELAHYGGFNCSHLANSYLYKVSKNYRRHVSRREVSTFQINLADRSLTNFQLSGHFAPAKLLKMQQARIDFALRHKRALLLGVALTDYKGGLTDTQISQLENHENPEIRMITKHLTLENVVTKTNHLFAERARISL